MRPEADIKRDMRQFEIKACIHNPAAAGIMPCEICELNATVRAHYDYGQDAGERHGECECGARLEPIADSIAEAYIQHLLAVLTPLLVRAGQQEQPRERKSYCSADETCTHECPANEPEARMDELKDTVIALCDPEFSVEQRKTYIKGRIATLRAALAAAPPPS